MKSLICFAVIYALAVSQVSCGKCESKFTEWGAWSHGRNGELKFPVPDHTAKWRIDIVFDSPVNSIDAWEGKKEKCIPAKNKCFFENEHWNGVNEAGQVLRLGFQKNFDETDSTPKIEKVIFKYCTSEDCDGWTRVVIECGEEDGSEDETPASEEETNASEEEQNESEEEAQTEVTHTDAPESEESVEESEEEEDTDEETDGECSLGPDYPGATIGHLTVYAASPSGNNCDLNWSNLEASGLDGWTHFAALPKNPGTDADRYEAGANCGRCVKVKCSCHQELFPGACKEGKEVIVMVTDSCPSCPYVGDLDLSNAAWDDVSGNEGPSKYDGTWEFIECPSNFKSGPMKLRMKGGSSKYWHAFQPENHKNKVTSMSINGVEMIFGDIDGFWWKGAGIMEFPAKVTMNNENGECASITLNGEDEVFGDNELVMEGKC